MQDDCQNNSQKIINTIGAVIKNYRELQNKTIYKISAEASISKAVWREVEIGASKDIKLLTLWKISEGLDVPLDKLIEKTRKELGGDFSLSDLK